jgi:phage tail tube protein FII
MLCAISVEQLPAFTKLMESYRKFGCSPSAPVDMKMACELKEEFDVTMAWFDEMEYEVHV